MYERNSQMKWLETARRTVEESALVGEILCPVEKLLRPLLYFIIDGRIGPDDMLEYD